MIRFEVNDEMARRHLLTLASMFPRETKRALSRYGGLLRRRLAKGVRSKAGIGLSAIRDALHPGAAGGPLSSAKSLKVEKHGPYAITVDWIEPLRPYASRWQSGGDVGFSSSAVRRAIHARLGARGMRELPVDPAATQPMRSVTAPVRAQAAAEAPRVILGMLKSILAKKG